MAEEQTKQKFCLEFEDQYAAPGVGRKSDLGRGGPVLGPSTSQVLKLLERLESDSNWKISEASPNS